MKRLKISWLPMWVTVVLMLCVSVTLCGVVFYSLKEAHAEQTLSGGHNVAITSVSQTGAHYRLAEIFCFGEVDAHSPGG